MNPFQKYINSHQTIGYLSLSKQMPIYKKTPKKNALNRYSNYENNETSNLNINNGYQFLTKYISKKKFQGILDTTSPGNKDVIIDTDSEAPSKNLDNMKNNKLKKTKCAKLVIDKVESQVPGINGEYYKFTNQKRVLNRAKTTFFTKKNYFNKNSLLRNSSFKLTKEDSDNENYNYNLLSQTKAFKNGYAQPFSNYCEYTKNINNNKKFSKDNYIYKTVYNFHPKNKLYNRGNTNKSQSRNCIKANKESTIITRSPGEYIRSIEASTINPRDNSPFFGKNYKIYENDNEGINIFAQDSIYSNKKKEPRFYFIYNRNNSLINNKNTSEESKRNSIYDNYKDLIRIKNFSNLNNKSFSKFIIYPGFKEKLIKIQSAWRGAYVRELMHFYWNLTNFKDILSKAIKRHIKDYFRDFVNKLNKSKDAKKKITIGNGANLFRKKYTFKINKDKDKDCDKDKKEMNLIECKKYLKQKEEDYENLLKNYNALVERCTELQQKINQQNNSKKNNKEENKNNNNKSVIWKELDLDSNNINYGMKLKDIQSKEDNSHNIIQIIPKKFDIIIPQQKDTFHIIQIKNKILINNNENLKNKKKLNEQSNSIEKQEVIQYLNKIKIKEPFKTQKQGIIKFEYQKSPKVSNIIKKQEEIQIISKKANKFQEYYENYSSNLYSTNTTQFSIKEIQKVNKIPLEITNNELSLIIKNAKIGILKEICQNECFNLISNKKEKIPIIEISKRVILSLISTEQRKPSINKICYKESAVVIIHKKKEKSLLNIITQNESFTYKNKVIKPKLLEKNIINKNNNIEFSIIDNINKENQIDKKNELVCEIQINSNLEIKGLLKEKKFKNLIIDKKGCNINIAKIKERKIFHKELISINNEIIINIIIEKQKRLFKENISKEKIIEILIEKNKANKYKDINICENERFNLIYNNMIFKKHKIDFIEEKRDNILLTENNINVIKNKNHKYDVELIIVKKNYLFIQQIKKITSDKETEITEELNKLEQNNHFELIFEGKLNLSEDLLNKNKAKNINKDIKNTNNINNINNIIDNRKEELFFIKNVSKEEKEKPAQKVNYNKNNEIDKGDGLEINPFELKRTKNNANNIFISYQNKLQVLHNKNDIFTEKAKQNMMKIILPIRLKTTLRDFVRRNTLPLLINNLKKIAYASYLNKIENKIKDNIEKKEEKKDKDKIPERKKSQFFKISNNIEKKEI